METDSFGRACLVAVSFEGVRLALVDLLHGPPHRSQVGRFSDQQWGDFRDRGQLLLRDASTLRGDTQTASGGGVRADAGTGVRWFGLVPSLGSEQSCCPVLCGRAWLCSMRW